MNEVELRKIFSSNIKCFRSLRGWSQAKLAEKMEISTNFLADIETGKSWISSFTLIKLANCLEIDVYELFRPRNVPPDEVKESLKSIMNEVSVVIEHSLSKICEKYL